MKRNALLALGAIIALFALLPAGASATGGGPLGSPAAAPTTGGDTSVVSGNASGGNGSGGDASANGGSASNNALVGQSSSSSGPVSSGSGNSSTLTQGNNSANGGSASGGDGTGGDANSGNTVVGNGNAVAFSPNGNAKAEGGDTQVKSGNAYGGNGYGGDANANGGNASNNAAVKQTSQSENANGCGCESHDKWSKDGKSSFQPNSGSESDQGNDSQIKQGDNTANGGSASGGDGYGGDANSGNTVIGNGNAAAVSFGGDSTYADFNGSKFGDKNGSGTEAKGGNTYVQSGNASGGDGKGGDANANGGKASNNAAVWQQSDSQGKGCGCEPKGGPKKDGPRGPVNEEQPGNGNVSKIDQGNNSANGGSASGGDGTGGDANSGNTVKGNGNALAVSLGGGQYEPAPVKECDCFPGGGRGSETKAEGGDTHVQSGNAYGGNGKGGDANANGGYAHNNAVVGQSDSQSGCGCGKSGSGGGNTSQITQGNNTANGGSASGGDGTGGNANSGNTVKGNGNALAFGGSNESPCIGACFSSGGGSRGSDTKAEGGDTWVKSGNASGGDGKGGDANANGGKASNNAAVWQQSDSQSSGCGCEPHKWDTKKDGGPHTLTTSEDPGSGNTSEIKQGDNTANGGSASGGDGTGGNANSGNTVKYNGNAGSFGGSSEPPVYGISGGKGFPGFPGGSGTKAEGGDTWVKSGNAYGGDGKGGNASANGGYASNNAVVKQDSQSQNSQGCGCEPKKWDGKDGGRSSLTDEEGSGSGNTSNITQGNNSANGGSASGGDGTGGDANSGNTVKYNGNAGSFGGGGGYVPATFSGSKGFPGPRDSGNEAEGGDTHVQSGNASGGNGYGGKANANGGKASNNAVVWQQSDSQSKGCGCEPKSKPCESRKDSKGFEPSCQPGGGGSESGTGNDSHITQGNNSANGGSASGGDGTGGNANSGNTVKYNGNAGVFDFGGLFR